jgi:hypothetical protein
VVVKIVGMAGGVALAHIELLEPAKPWDEGANYYSTSDQAERLPNKTLDECIEGEFDVIDPCVEITAARGFTVYALRRDAIDVEAEAKSSLDDFVTEIAESIADEYGDPDGHWDGGIATKDAEKFKAIVMPALVAMLATVEPWRCHVIGERTFTPEELMEWVRKNNPKWLEGRDARIDEYHGADAADDAMED